MLVFDFLFNYRISLIEASVLVHSFENRSLEVKGGWVIPKGCSFKSLCFCAG